MKTGVPICLVSCCIVAFLLTPLDVPKSLSLQWIGASSAVDTMRRLSGFRSLWSIDEECRNATPRAQSVMHLNLSIGENSCFFMQDTKLPSGRNSF